MPKLTVAIPTIESRSETFRSLLNHICTIAYGYDVEVIYCCDNKEISIGAKRQQLLERATGEYIFMLDDDDTIPDYYFKEVFAALEEKPDCIGYLEQVGLKVARHTIANRDWHTNGNRYERTIFYKDVIKTDLARKAGFKDMRYGEDYDFAKRLKPLLHKEVYIGRIMYIYNEPKNLSVREHNIRYGIK